MAARGAANGQYTVIISVDAQDAEATLASLAGTVDATGSSMQTIAPKVSTLGGALDGTTARSAAAAVQLDRAEGKARSLLRTLETGALNGSASSLNSALAGMATSGGTAAVALGAAGIAAVALTGATIGAANVFSEQALALEDAARAAGVLTPEIEANADKAREWQESTQNLNDEWNELVATLGSGVVEDLANIANGVAALVENFQNLIDSSDGLRAAFDTAFLGPILDALGEYGAAQDDATLTDAERTRNLQALTAALKERTQAELDAADAAEQYAQDALNAAQADLRVEQVRANQAQQAADAEKARTEAIAAAKKSQAAAEDNLTSVKEQAAERSKRATEALADAERRLREARRPDIDQARNLADAQLRLRRVQEDIASGRLAGTDATRALQDANSDLNRTQEDNIEAERQRQNSIADAERDVQRAKEARREAEKQGAADIRRAQDRLRESVDKVTDAQKRAGRSALQRRADELQLNAALSAQAAAHRKVREDVDKVRAAIQNGTLSWGEFQKILKDLHVTTFPQIKQDLAEINAALYSMPGSSYAVGGSTYNSQVPSASSGSTNIVDGIVQGASAFTVNVNAPGIITNKASVDALAERIVPAIVAEMKRQNASGVRYNIK